MRNEHLLHLMFYLDDLGRHEEALEVVNKMMQPERVNPFPGSSFLIEGRAYYNTGTLLSDMKEKLTKRGEEPIIDMNSIPFDFK